MLTIIVVRSEINGQWGYCPKDARHMLKPEQDEHAPYRTVRDALNAIALDKTIPPLTNVEVIDATDEDMRDTGMPFLAAAKAAFDSLELECNAGPAIDPLNGPWPFPRGGKA